MSADDLFPWLNHLRELGLSKANYIAAKVLLAERTAKYRKDVLDGDKDEQRDTILALLTGEGPDLYHAMTSMLAC